MAIKPRVEFSQAIFDKICEGVADGKSVREVCSAKGMPDRATFNRWRKMTPELEAQYALCRIDREDAIFDDIQWIADHERDPKRAKVMIDAREWKLARMNGKKYGNRIQQELTGADGGPVALVLNGSDVHG
jgi:hypothetical protein